MTTHTDASGRPSLEPLWTSYNLGNVPGIALRATPSPAGLSPSPMSPGTLPSPLYPRSYDGSMSSQDRALVISLDRRSRHPSLASPVSLAPIEEQAPLASRFEKATILPPINVKNGLLSPISPPNLTSSQEGFRIPEYDGPASVSPRAPRPQHARPSFLLGRRDSAPAVPRLVVRKNSGLDGRNQLRLRGHLYYGDAQTADAFVVAVSLRRPRNPASGGHAKKTTTIAAAAAGQQCKSPKRRTFLVNVHSRAIERQSFRLQCSFDMDKLRATIPDRPLSSAQGEGMMAHASRSLVSPGDGECGGATSLPQQRPPTDTHRRRSSNVKLGALLPGLRSTAWDPEGLMQYANAVPIRE